MIGYAEYDSTRVNDQRFEVEESDSSAMLLGIWKEVLRYFNYQPIGTELDGIQSNCLQAMQENGGFVGMQRP